MFDVIIIFFYPTMPKRCILSSKNIFRGAITLGDRKCVFQNKACQHQLPLKDGVWEKLDDFVKTIMSSLPEDLQMVLSTHRVYSTPTTEQTHGMHSVHTEYKC